MGVALVGAGLVLVAFVAFSRAQLVKSVRELPAADRAALYHRTLTDVERPARPPRPTTAPCATTASARPSS